VPLGNRVSLHRSTFSQQKGGTVEAASTADDTQLAQVKSARGYEVGNYLLLQIAGEKPSPCYEVDIAESPIDIFPPEFSAALKRDPDAICPAVVVPYDRTEVFAVANLGGKSVQLHTGGGTIEVEVQKVDEAPEGAGVEGASSVDDVIGPPAEAVGYSDKWDLKEAMEDAIEQLPKRGGNIPDWLDQYEVVSIEAEIGGLAAFHHLKVRVRG
jgi:hypothetical protein